MKKSLVHLHGSLNISLHGSLNMHPYLFVHLIHTKEIYLKTYMIQKLLFLILIFSIIGMIIILFVFLAKIFMDLKNLQRRC